jgi:hypothetical protein
MKKIKSFHGLLLIGLIIIFLSACKTFQVSDPRPSDFNAVYNGFSQDAAGHIVIPVTFNEAVDQSTVAVGVTLFLKFTKDPNTTATLSWSADSKKLTITTVKTRDQLMSFNPDDGFCLTLRGSSKIIPNGSVVKSRAGVVLDGNYDGKPGGNYNMCFFIIG